jgi:hypothetical protein
MLLIARGGTVYVQVFGHLSDARVAMTTRRRGWAQLGGSRARMPFVRVRNVVIAYPGDTAAQRSRVVAAAKRLTLS